MRVYAGMDLHRKRSQVAIVDDAGVQQRDRNLPNDPAKLVPVLGRLPPGTRWRSRRPTAGDGWAEDRGQGSRSRRRGARRSQGRNGADLADLADLGRLGQI
jgi:hypothetical protein